MAGAAIGAATAPPSRRIPAAAQAQDQRRESLAPRVIASIPIAPRNVRANATQSVRRRLSVTPTTGRARKRLSTGGTLNAPRKPTPRSSRRNRVSVFRLAAVAASGASQASVASPANPPADSFRLFTPSPRARLGWPLRWLP